MKAEEIDKLYETFKRAYPKNKYRAKLELYNHLVRECKINWSVAVDIITSLR